MEYKDYPLLYDDILLRLELGINPDELNDKERLLSIKILEDIKEKQKKASSY